MEKRRYSFILMADSIEKIDKLAQNQGLSRTALLQLIINNFLKMKGEHKMKQIKLITGYIIKLDKVYDINELYDMLSEDLHDKVFIESIKEGKGFVEFTSNKNYIADISFEIEGQDKVKITEITKRSYEDEFGVN